MYQALYRKYRPEIFSDVVGQDVIIKTLKNAIKLNKISHAYLFTGPRGTGKTTVAKIFANEINKTSPNYKQTDNNVDVIEIDAASNNGVDEIREIKSKVNLVPSNGKYKVYIIDEVHMLTVGAFNALLKTLEEPPAHIIFILATTEPHKIPITILSRCQRFDFKKISLNVIVEQLKKISSQEKIEITEEALFEIAKISDGGMRDAISILDQVSSYDNEKLDVDDVHEVSGSISKEKIEELLENIINKNLDLTLKMLTKMDDDGKNLIRVMEDATYYLKDILVSITKKEKNINSKLFNNITPLEIIEIIKEFMNSLSEMKKYGDPKFIFEITIIKLMSVDSNTKIENINENQGVKNTQTKTNYKIDISENQKVSENEFVDKNKIITEEVQTHEIKDTIDIERVISVRINNAFTSISRKILTDLKSGIEEIRSYLLDNDYKDIAGLVLDGEMKAASTDYIIFVYDDIRLSEEFNYSIPLVEELIKKVYKKNYKVISVDILKWNKYKDEYKESRQKKKKYIFIEEDFDLNILKKNYQKNMNKIEKLFSELIEYK